MIGQSDAQSIVLVIDDDASVREAPLKAFSVGRLAGQGFRLNYGISEKRAAEYADCLVLDVRLPGSSGLEFQSDLAKANCRFRSSS